MIGIISLAVKATLVIVCAFAIVRMMRRGRASVRHGLYASMFVTLLILPAVSILFPQSAVTLPLVSIAPAADSDARFEPLSLSGTEAEEAGTLNPGVTQTSDSVDLYALSISAYQIIVILLVLRLAVGVARLSLWGHRAELWLRGSKVAADVAFESGIRRAVVVVTSADVSVPMTYGFRKQTILMPKDASEWDDEAVRRAIRHELAHVRRDDWVIQLLARGACAIYWAHPLVWIALRRFQLEAERACDDSVVHAADASLYADQLVTLARNVARQPSVPALAMASRSKLSERVHAILDSKQPRGPLSRAALILMMSGTAAILLTAGSVSLVAATEEVSAGAPAREADVNGASSPMNDAVHDGVEGGIEDGIREGVAGVFDEDLEIYRESIVKAAEKGNIKALSLFFEDHGIDINTPFIGDGTAVLIASRHGHTKAVQWMLDRGADPNVPSPGDGNALIAAAGEGETEIMRMLLERGARIEDVVPGDENALITASAKGKAGAVKLLVERGADVNARVWADDREWRTPLSMARRGDHDDVVRLLIAAGARQ